jgi:hypothetical protein
MSKGVIKPTGSLVVTIFLALIMGFSLTALALGVKPIPASASMLINALPVEDNTVDELEIKVTPVISVGETGASHSLTATVTGTGNQPVSDIEVHFEVVRGPNAGVTGTGATGSNGTVTFTYTSRVADIDIISACITDGGDKTGCALAMKIWTRPTTQYRIALEPARSSNPVGTQHTVTATVTDGADPVTGARVNFAVASGPTQGVTGSSVTGDSGQARFRYEGVAPGQDIIHACVTDSHGTESCARAAKTWTERAAPPRNSCRGEDSCRGENISVGQNSCNAENTCNGNNIVIGDNSCNEEDACRGNGNTIGDRSCNGEESCRRNQISIGDNSCNDEESCRGNRLTVGNGSCSEEESCIGNNGRIGNRSCNGEEACVGHNITIGNGSCNAEEACVGQNNTVGDNTCNREEACSGRGNSRSQGQGQGQGNSARGGRT